MLSRVADSLYWMARYMERAENLARLMQAGTELLLDEETLSARGLDNYWDPVLIATAQESLFQQLYPNGSSADVGMFMTLSEENPDSIAMCLRSARENARTVRDQISDEMWTELNDLYLFITARSTTTQFQRAPQNVYDRIIRGSLLFHGITSATMPRNEGWHFIQLGKYLERADKTSRFLDIRMNGGEASGGRSPDSVQWTSILRSAGAFGTYRSTFGSEVTAESVIDLLVFATEFPRSARFCARAIDSTLHAISGTPAGMYANKAERLAGRLLANLNFGGRGEVLERGLTLYIDDLQRQLNELGNAVFEVYVLIPQDKNNLTFIPSPPDRQRMLWEKQQQQQQQ